MQTWRFVEWGITEDEYKQITGLTYPMTKQPVSVDLGSAAIDRHPRGVFILPRRR
nr:hypothetical protein [Bacillus velezensis]